MCSAGLSPGRAKRLGETRPKLGACDRPSLREAVLAHAGEALEQKRAFARLTKYEQDAVIEFLESLQVLPPGTRHRIVDEHSQGRAWPPPSR